MKNMLKILAVMLVAMMMIVPALADEGRPNITAHKADGITIDGNLDDWNLDGAAAVVNDASQLIKDAHLWKGANDLSVTFYLAWNEENLYFAADVTEDTPLGAIEMLPIDGEDNIVLHISTDPAADPERTEYGTNDFMIYFVMDEGDWSTAVDRSMLAKEVMKSVRYKSIGMDGGENVLPGYECAITKTTTGFIWEAVIPWTALSMENELQDKKCSLETYTPAAGDVLAVDFSITDIDYPCPGTEYIPQMAWTGSKKIEANPSLWGSVTLAE